jgi:hypothetical protein
MRNQGLTERLVIMIDGKMRKALDTEHEKSGAPIGAIVRRALEAYFKWKK